MVRPAVSVGGVAYQAQRCAVSAGSHELKSNKPFGVVAYGYASAASYAFVGGMGF